LVIFFLYLTSVVITFHGREIAMLDYTPTFDHWWYFYHRLRDGALAQWNPYSLLGRIAVQWHYLPVSILSPLMVWGELTLARFHALHIVGTTLVLIALYAAGRIAGYGATLPLLGVVLVAATGFRYWMSFLHFATFLTVFPLLVAWLVSRGDRRAPLSAREIAGLGLGLALAFLGLRLELMVYAVALLLLGFLSLAWAGDRGGRPAHWIGSGGAVAGLALAASAWQLAFLVASTIESQRGALMVSPGRLLDGELVRWLLASMVLQPLLLLMLLNLALAGVCRKATAWVLPPLPARGLVALLALEGGAAWALHRLGRLLASSLAPALSPADLGGALEIAASPAGLAAVLLAALAVWRAGPVVTLPRALAAAAALSAGFAVSSYAGGTWVVNTAVHPYFVPLPLTGLLALGAVGLWLRGRTWVVATLAAYHVVGEVGSLPLYESLGLPWFPPRAALVELPFQLMLALETARTVGGLLAAALERSVAAPILRSPTAARLAGLACLIVATILLHRSLLPTELADDPRGFPFGARARDVSLPNGSLEHWEAGADGRLVPSGCEYHPAPGAALARVTETATGGVAAALLPSGRADSWLRCDVADVTPLRGRFVRLSAAIRSEASYAGAVQIDVQDGTGSIAFERSDIRSAGPTAPGWARRAVVTRVHPQATRLFLTVNATFAADAAVLVDDLRLEVAEAPAPRQRVYVEDFPFARTPVDAAPWATTAWVRDALVAADTLRHHPAADADPFHRRYVPDDVFLLSPGEQYYRFLPAYSRTLNTAPLYASEIPAALVRLFRDLPEARAEPAPPRPAHPDMAPILRAYKRAELARTGRAEAFPYPAQVAILPHRRGRPVGRALLAEEGDRTPRAFLASRVVRFEDAATEHAHLTRRLDGGGTLAEGITTSDPAFPADRAKGGADARPSEALGAVAFIRDEPEHVALAVSAERDAYVVLLDLWSPGWRATVDGRRAPVYRAYGAARFVAVPAGRHVVEFTYRVPGLPAAAGISALAALAGLVVLTQRTRHR
jgi:hypothetical protein